jgi:5-bromo-4-chloroindolyl phosphate hydrolysis protein
MDKLGVRKRSMLRSQSVQLAIEFIRAELQSGLIFAALAQTEHSLGSPDGAAQASANAKKAYDVVLKHLAKTELSDEDTHWIKDQLKQLKQALAQFPI